MNHEKTVIYFTKDSNSYVVEYSYDKTNYNALKASVSLNGTVIKEFNPLPYTKTNNPTKSQAKELITIANRENKNGK